MKSVLINNKDSEIRASDVHYEICAITKSLSDIKNAIKSIIEKKDNDKINNTDR